MPRRPQLQLPDVPYHVYARSNNREHFFIPGNEVWSIMLTNLSAICEMYSVRLISFVLMPNHFHMLIESPQTNLPQAMNYFMREVSRSICRRAGRINHVFGGRYKSSLILDPLHFAHVYKYVYRNPVRAGLTEKVENYPYSSLRFILKRSTTNIRFVDLDSAKAKLLPLTSKERLGWLNLPTPKEHEETMRKGLRRVEFALSKRKRVPFHQKEVGTFLDSAASHSS